MGTSESTLKLALIGAGHLGGSFAMALREGQPSLFITAYDTAPAHAHYLHARGIVDAVAPDLTAAVAEADIVMLAIPMGSYRACAATMAPALRPGTIVTDLGSVKQTMVALSAMLPQARIVGGHPIAGGEQSGPEAARSDLFRGRLCVLTPDSDTDANALAVVESLWSAIGADVIALPPALHDQLYAYVSHLPHYIAFTAAAYLESLGIRVGQEQESLQRFLRISRSNPRMWTDIALENREAILPVLATYGAVLQHFATELRAGGDAPETGIDSATAAQQLLPRILAASLISTVSLYEQQSGQNLRPFAAGGMRDVAAPAAQSPEADTEAISGAASLVAHHLDAVFAALQQTERLLGAGNGEALLALLTQQTEQAHRLVLPRA